MTSFLSFHENLFVRNRRKCIGEVFRNLRINRNVSFQSLYEGSINSLAVETVENKYLLCGTSSGVIAIYDLSIFHGKNIFAPVAHIGKSSQFCPADVNSVSWYPLHTGLFASSGDNGFLTIWDTNQLKPLEKYRIGCPIYSHAFGIGRLSSSLIAVACEQHTIRIVDFRIGSSSHVLDAFESASICVAWSPSDERLISSGGKNGRVLLWDIRSCKSPLVSLAKQSNNIERKQKWKQVHAHSGAVIGLQFADDNISLLSLGRDRFLRAWDSRTARWLGDLANLSNNMMPSLHHVDIATIASDSSPPITIVPDGKSARVISLWSGETMCRLNGHFDQITSIVVFNDRTYRVITSSHDQSMLLWSFQPRPMNEEKSNDL